MMGEYLLCPPQNMNSYLPHVLGRQEDVVSDSPALPSLCLSNAWHSVVAIEHKGTAVTSSFHHS